MNIYPRKTEKSYALSQSNVYVFDVPESANTNQISDAVEAIYGVKVKSVRTLIQNGKRIRYSRGKRSYPGTTSRQDLKKAYVTLEAGNAIKMFEEVASDTADKKETK